MRILALLVLCVALSAIAEARKSVPADWTFGCHKDFADKPKNQQPCWVQSRVIQTTDTIDKKDIKGKLYFQVHFFSEKTVLRVFIVNNKKGEIEFLVPFVDREKGHSFALTGEMNLRECRGDLCAAEAEIDEEALASMTKPHRLSLLGATVGEDKKAWGYTRILSFSNFKESIDKARAHRASWMEQKKK